MIDKNRLKNVANKLYLFKLKNGRNWKSKLKELFNSGMNKDEDLQLFRNKFLELLPKLKNDFNCDDIEKLLTTNSIEV